MRPTGQLLLISIALSFFAFSSAAPGSDLEADTALIRVGDRSWTFSLSGSPGSLCKTTMLGNKDGITAMGNEIATDGSPLPRGARVEIVVYPEDWVPKGTQSNGIKIDAPGKDADWMTTTPTLTRKNTNIGDLARATVHTWSLAGGRAEGTATFYLKDSLSKAKFGGELVLVDGSFEIFCLE